MERMCVRAYLLFDIPVRDRDDGWTAVRWGTAMGGPSEWKVLGIGVGIMV